MANVRKRRLFLAAGVVVLAGAGISSASADSSAAIRRILPLTADLAPLHVLEPAHALQRTTLVIAAARAENLLESGRPWAAWQEIEPFLKSEHLTPGTTLLAARAAAGWGGWSNVRSLLAGASWLDVTGGGDGWLLLARAEESSARWSSAAAAYQRYAEMRTGRERGLATARRASALLRSGDPTSAAQAFEAAAADLERVADWLAVRRIEALAEAGLVGGVPVAAPTGSPIARSRWALASSSLLLAAGDSAAAVDRLEREMRSLMQRRALVEGAGLVLEWSRLVGGGPRRSEARDQLRALAWETTLPASVRVRAADRLGDLAGSPAPAEELARAAAYEAGNRPGHAARSLRAAIAGGLVDDPESRFRLGRLLFDAADHRPAREALLTVAPALEPELAAEAALLAARARFRGGDRAGGMAELRAVADRHAGTAAAGTANFLLADAAATIPQALPLYRRAAFSDAPEAAEALFRLGDRRQRVNDHRGAADAWDEYLRRFPTGGESARIAYAAGLLNLRIGRPDAARKMFAATIEADPLSYYALRAGERIGEDPLDAILRHPRPWIGLTSDPAEARLALERLDLLEEAGLDTEWREELDASIRRLGDRPLALVTLAEGLGDRGRVQDAVRLGRRIVEMRDGQWDGRLLRVTFPFPYRELIEREAERYRVDPMLFAGLIRQESMFQPAVRSRVGATGLSQIMPATGRWIAPRVGVPADRFSESFLTVPEVNLRMGALYLGDLMRRYNGAMDLALAGYNAGPGRADRWRRELGHGRDVDAFRDAIPFDETRHYVRVVLRNTLVYQRLYGSPGPVGEAPQIVAAE
jgi:soluble lytic murein transglycosylase